MDLKSIREKLNSEFKGLDRKIVFWFDDKAEFIEEIDSLSLDNASVYRLEKDNFFYTKYFLEKKDSTNNYLVYATFPKPADKDNHLADTIYYSKEFYADKISLLCVDLSIPQKYKEHLALYPKFWNSNERIEKFIALGIENYNNEEIDIGLLAALANVKTPNFDEIIKTIFISESYQDNKYLDDFNKMGLISAFWELCNKYFGYSDEKPTLEKFVITLFITHFKHEFTGELPKVWQSYISLKENNVYTFVKNIMSNVFCKDKFEAISDKIALKIKATEFLQGVSIEKYINCDTFKVIDRFILRWITNRLLEENTSATINKDVLKTIIDNRLSESNHYNETYNSEYRLLSNALKLIEGIKNNISLPDDIFKYYAADGCLADTWYRHFYFYFDKLENIEPYSDLRVLIENVYTNEYLEKSNAKCINYLTNNSNISFNKQKDFYANYLKSSVGKERVVVIISDAFRYECGKELLDMFLGDAKCEAKLEWNLGNIPSFTRLGMASLLPHKQIEFDDNFKITVDGKPCDDLVSREKILQSYVPNSVCVKYDEVIRMKRDELRPLFANKDIVYIYHNQIDARGDEASSENEVFTACKEAINEIYRLARKLTEDVTAVRYIITADHGFIYKRDKLAESDKVSNVNDLPTPCYKNKRFILTKNRTEIFGTHCFSLSYLGENNKDIFATLPVGVDIFKTAGGGQNYVHGGSSLQEIVIPVLKVKTSKGRKETDNVEVVLTSISRKITNLITYIDFMQKDNVTDVLLPIELKVYFENEDGEKISSENIVNAGLKNAPPEKRLFHEKFTFRNRKYSRSDKNYLVMQNTKTDEEVARFEYIIDIAFSDDFGFGL